MTKNSIINALSASGYIVLVVSLMTIISQMQKNKPDTFLDPLVVLFMLTLSVSVMAYLFFYQPLMLFISGKKKEGVNLFVKTTATFAGITIIILALLFSGIIK